jgi:hypothetical protein
VIGSLILAFALSGPVPTYLVERIVTAPQGTRRVSVFLDRTAVLAWHAPGGEPTVLRRRLDVVVFRSLEQVVRETTPDLREFSGFSGVPGEASIEIRLAPPGERPLDVRLPVTAALSVAMSRLQHAIDDIDTLLSRTRPDQQDLSAWVPTPGQRVALSDGRTVTVLEVLNDGAVVHVRVGDGPGEVYFASDELRRLAIRLVGP